VAECDLSQCPRLRQDFQAKEEPGTHRLPENLPFRVVRINSEDEVLARREPSARHRMHGTRLGGYGDERRLRRARALSAHRESSAT
jgi:hypothetical protein